MITRKKVRGATRKCKAMINDINEQTSVFPMDEKYREYGYWNTGRLPYYLLNSTKTPAKVKRAFMQTLVSQTQHLINIKPIDEKTRVFASIELPNLSYSAIEIFFGDKHYSNFFERNVEEPTWIPLPPHRNIAKEYAMAIPEGMTVRGYKEICIWEGRRFIAELWFIGEIE